MHVPFHWLEHKSSKLPFHIRIIVVKNFPLNLSGRHNIRQHVHSLRMANLIALHRMTEYVISNSYVIFILRQYQHHRKKIDEIHTILFLCFLSRLPARASVCHLHGQVNIAFEAQKHFLHVVIYISISESGKTLNV